jgi:hypothetical protein
VQFQKQLDIGSRMKLDEMTGLKDINTIESSGEAKLGKRGLGFIRKLKVMADNVINFGCKGRMINSKIESIDLSTEESRRIVNGGVQDILLMDGVLEAKVSWILKDLCNMALPEATSFGMPLKGMTKRNHQVTSKLDAKSDMPPISKSGVNSEVTSSGGPRRMHVGIACIPQLILGCSKSTLELEDWHFNTRSIGF